MEILDYLGASFASAALWGPQLSALVVSVAFLIICLRGHAELPGHGWRLLAGAGALQAVRQILATYSTYLITYRPPSGYGAKMGLISAAGFLISCVMGFLMLAGLLCLQADIHRARGQQAPE